MSTITTIELEKLTIANETELTKFYDNANHDEASTTLITDAYGFEKLAKDVMCHSGYLIPKAKISPEVVSDNYSLTPERYASYKSEYEWIKLISLRIRHQSDFEACLVSGLLYPREKLRTLDEAFYEEGTSAHKSLVRDSGYANYILTEDAVDVVGHYEKYHEDDENLVYSEHHDMHILECDVVYPEDDPDTPYHEDSCYCRNDVWYTSQDAANEGCIRDYHCTCLLYTSDAADE